MSKTHTIKVDEKRNGDGSMTYGATVTEHHADGDFSSFYRSRNLNAAHAMANGLAMILEKNSAKRVKIEVLDVHGRPISEARAA
ncbi:MAG: hypothetical protein MRY75_03025 [Marivita sp.]|uniref:hypothetical protein n=1 Tax=Marivita sp. TaxID=2003365 RepID=UPI0025B9F613|nr:hypothetical protein [Marivita sp.]MCI5109502.1 hypothetical protein [Marivita sp.]